MFVYNDVGGIDRQIVDDGGAPIIADQDAAAAGGRAVTVSRCAAGTPLGKGQTWQIGAVRSYAPIEPKHRNAGGAGRRRQPLDHRQHGRDRTCIYALGGKPPVRMAKIILHVDHEQRRRRDIDVHGLRHRGKRNNPLLLSWAHEAQSLVSADLVHGLTVAARGAGAHRARPTLQAPCLPATWGRPVLASGADFFLEWCCNRLRGAAVGPSRAVALLFLPSSHLPAEIPSSCRRRCTDVSHSNSAGPSRAQGKGSRWVRPVAVTPRPFLCG